jgi:hypothetical protein
VHGVGEAEGAYASTQLNAARMNRHGCLGASSAVVRL